MEVSIGAMASLLPKLGELIIEEYKLPMGVREDLASVRDDLWDMEAILVMVGDRPRDKLDEQTRIWIDEVREMSYAMEYSVDRFIMSTRSDSEPDFSGFRQKMIGLIMKNKPRHRIGVEIKEVKDQVRQLSGRCDRHKVHDLLATISVELDPRLQDLYTDHTELVGVQESSDELIRRLLSDGGDNQHQLKVLSIFGFAGVGKTTLAKAVYHRIRTRFDCTVIVSVGPNPGMRKVLKDILQQIDKEKYSDLSAAAVDERKCIDEIRGLLDNQRYFIIVDDLWDISAWEVIRCTLMDCNFGSIVITTTWIYDVAANAGDVYKLEPLFHAKSEELFYTKLFGGEVKLPGDQTTELVQKILQRCGGVPLTITTIASFLSNKPKEDWYKVYDSINFGRTGNKAVDNIRTIILFSYYDLPFHLKACLLHLSIFPKNYVVRKDTLIWKWVAEGFILEGSGRRVFEVGEMCFNELINRSMIQPVEISHSGVIIGCRVHAMVHDIIYSMANGKNFVTLLNGNKHDTSVKLKARRLALHGEILEEQYPLADTGMSQVRSFNAFMCHTTRIPSLSRFEVLRVLAIEDCRSFQPEDSAYSLECITKLLHLRYLGLWKTTVRELPEGVGNLNLLEILDLRQTGIRELPRSVSLLRRLMCLRADGGSTRVPGGIGNLISLEELSLNDVSSCPNFVKEVSKLTGLRELKICVRVLDQRSKKALVKSLGNLQKIQVLHLDGGLSIEDDEWEGYVPPRQLRHLSLRIKSSRLPRWIDNSLLLYLSHLSVDVRYVEPEDLTIIGSFPELITLELFVPNSVSLGIKGSGAFPKLRHCYASGMLSFLHGAAPRLESVHFNVLLSDLNDASFQCGSLGSLPLLKEVRVEIFYSDVHGAAEVEKKLRHAVEVHVNRPILHVSKYKSSFDEDAEGEDKSELEEDDEEDEWYTESPTAKVAYRNKPAGFMDGLRRFLPSCMCSAGI